MQDEALVVISESLKEDPYVQAIFVKGSMGRGEADDYSDIDLYCLVKRRDEEKFLKRRLEHLRKYGKLLFYEDFFIIAPQIIAVYDNFLHIDLYTVTEETYINKDYFQVIYDPDGLMEKYRETQTLRLTKEEFDDHVYDVAWYLFQYRKAMKRGNNLWAVEMLHFVSTNLAKVLLHRYSPDRAQLGWKALESLLPPTKLEAIYKVFHEITPQKHNQAVMHLIDLLYNETNWIQTRLQQGSKAGEFLSWMLSVLDEELGSQ